MIGAAPEAYEAALLQAYPGPSPLKQAFAGKISVRQLRVMLEHLPPGNPAQRELHGRWGDDQNLMHDISSHLRALYTLTANVYRQKGTPERELELLPTPDTKKPAVMPAEQRAEERDHLQAVLARRNPQ